MTEKVIASFPGYLLSTSVNLSIENATSWEIVGFGLSARTSKFPIVWDTVGYFSGGADVIKTEGGHHLQFFAEHSLPGKRGRFPN